MRRTQTKPNADLKRNDKLCQIRKCLINNIFDYCDCLDLRNITLQTAIVYIEKLLSVCKLDVIDKDKNLWSLGALSLACKYIELDITSLASESSKDCWTTKTIIERYL